MFSYFHVIIGCHSGKALHVHYATENGWGVESNPQFNLADFTKRAYGTNYVETLQVQVHANCRLRRIYFSDRLYSEEELPPEFKLYLPMQVRL